MIMKKKEAAGSAELEYTSNKVFYIEPRTYELKC